MRQISASKAALCALFSIIILIGSSVHARAQRTVLGQEQITVNLLKTVYPSASGSVIGGEVFYGKYSASYFWQAGIQFTPRYGSKVDTGCVTANYSLLLRLLSNRSRSVSLYAGGGLIAGLDFSRKTETDEETWDDYEVSKTVFVYGLEPRVELEVFPFSRTALVLGAAAPVKLSTQQDEFSVRAYLGVRFNLW